MTVVSNPNEYSVEGLVDTGSGNQRVIMTQSVNGTQQAYSETSVECIVEDSSGNKQRCVCVNDFGGGGGGGGGVTSVNGQTGVVTLDADDVLPSQTDNSGKFITTDGTNASWASINALQNEATGANSLAIGGSSAQTKCTAVGVDSKCVGYNAVAIGYNANATNQGVAIGCESSTSNMYNQVAIGWNAKSHNVGGYQIGSGTNRENNTLYVGWNGLQNYKLLDGTTGLIPAARLGSLPSEDGTYTLKLTISGGVPTLSWVAN